MKKNIHLIFGLGEVGSALKRVMENKTILYWFDTSPRIKDKLPESNLYIDVIHITFPQDKAFVENVRKIIKKYKPALTIIHSTTIPGTTKMLGERVVHSPILGQHSDLYKHISTFRKAIGPNSASALREAKKYLINIFDLEFYKDSTTTEVAKVLSLVKFAMNIEMARYSQEVCKKLRIDFNEAYTKFTKLYNDGYKINHLEKFLQPILLPPPKKIGGTCVLPGVIKAQAVLKSGFLNEILKKNKN